MALRIVGEDEQPIQTLRDLYPQAEVQPFPAPFTVTDPIGQQALRNAPMMQQPGRRYEDEIPYKPNWWERNVVPQSARETYLNRAQKFNQQKDQQARQNTILEANLMSAIQEAPVGRRDPQLKLLQRFYQQQGKTLDPELLNFYKKAEKEDWDLAQYAASELAKMYPDLDEQKLNSLINTNPAALGEFFTLYGKAKESKGKAEEMELKNTRRRAMNEELRQIDQTPTEAPESPQEPLSPPPVQGLGPGTQMPPGATQRPTSAPMASGWSDNRIVAQIRAESLRQGVDPDLMVAIAKQESGLDPKAVGDGGRSIGLFQLQPPAAQEVGLTPEQRVDPALNIRGGVSYMKKKLEQTGGNVQQALLRYNGGGDPNYVQNVQRFLPSYQKESMKDAPEGAQRAVNALDQSIQKDMQRLQALSRLSGDTEVDREHDNIAKRLELKLKQREAIEKKVSPKFQAGFEEYVGVRTSTNPANVDPIIKTRLFYEYKNEEDARELQRAENKAKVLLPYDIQKAQAGNVGNIINPEASKNIFNTSGQGPIHPIGKTNPELADENRESIAATGQPKWSVKGPMVATERQALNTSLSGIKAAQRVLEYAKDPDVAKLIGTLLSNPDGAVEKILAGAFGTRVTQKYHEIGAEISNLTSTILHARIGGAQTVGEYARLKPLIANMEAVTPQAFKAKMTILHNAMAEDFNTELEALEELGTATPKSWTKIKLLPTALDREKKEAAPEPAPTTGESTKPQPKKSNPFKEALQ